MGAIAAIAEVTKVEAENEVRLPYVHSTSFSDMGDRATIYPVYGR
jgi:hypothetical protein